LVSDEHRRALSSGKRVAWSVYGGSGRAIRDIASPVEFVSKLETLDGC
jgi:hypothetical protein